MNAFIHSFNISNITTHNCMHAMPANFPYPPELQPVDLCFLSSLCEHAAEAVPNNPARV